MKKIFKMLWIASMIGFSTATLASNQDLGTVVGGIAGGLIGNNLGHGSSRAVATVGGAVIGSFVGNQMGNAADARERYYGGCCPPRYSHWESYQRARVYPPIYKNTFIGRDGRLCRRTLLTNSFGDKLLATYCCYRTTPNGYCVRWVRTNI